MVHTSKFKKGLTAGIPIGLGYLPVSFTFGFIAVSGGLPVWMAVLISLTNLTSAGQFAGTNLILASAGYMEVALTTFVINLRYMLMSLAISQRLEKGVTLLERMVWSFGITDETFVVASMEKDRLTTPYMLGLITFPIVGWNAGTILGGLISTVLPAALQNAMGIALYAMFIALLVPACQESSAVFCIVIVSVIAACILKYVSAFSFISPGFRVIIATVVAAGSGALFMPRKEEVMENEYQ